MRTFLKKVVKIVFVTTIILSVFIQSFSQFVFAATADSKKTFREELIQMFKSGDMTTHDVSGYGFSYSEISAIFNSVIENECLVEYYCGASIVQSTTRSESGIIQTFKLLNMDSNFLPRLEKMKKTIDDALSGLSDEMSELEKALYLHDYLLSKSGYYNGNNLITRSAGNLLAYGNGVCQAYSDAYILLLKLSGISCSHVASSSMNHVWPVIKLDGEYYHIDPTWDDTRATNSISHKYFLRNDEEFKNLSHYSWINYFENITSKSDKYTDWFVHDIESPMYYYDGLWYFEDNNSIKCSTIDEGLSYTIVDGSLQTEKNHIINISNGILKYTKGNVTQTIALNNISDKDSIDDIFSDSISNDNISNNDTSNNDTSNDNVSCEKESAGTFDIYNMTDFSNYKNGHYSYVDGTYAPYCGRICLNDYVTAYEGITLTANISLPNYKIIIRELDKSKNFIKSVILSDNDVYTPNSYVKYLGISIYDSTYKPVTYNDYKKLFETGNIFALYSDTPIADIDSSLSLKSTFNDIYNMMDFSNFRYGYYNYYDGKYGAYNGRICLNDYQTAYTDMSYTAICIDDRFQILVREIDANGKMIASHSLKNKDTFTPDKNTVKLGISIYRSDFANITYEQYKALYENGFYAILVPVN